MSESRAWVFFYGTIMNPRILREQGATPDHVTPARLASFELQIRPRPNLVRSDRACVFGSAMTLSHEDLASIYSSLEQRFGFVYLPEAVLVETRTGLLRPALCYIAPAMKPAPADPDFVRQLAQCVRETGHPDWYAAYVESLA